MPERDEELYKFNRNRKKRFDVSSDGEVSQEDVLEPALSPEEMIGLKPRNAALSDEEWLAFVGFFGFSKTCGKLFMEYERQEKEAGRLPMIPPSAENPAMFKIVTFGHAGRKGFRRSGADFQRFTQYMGSRTWEPKDLGSFGKWFTEAEIDPRYIRPIIESYLTD